MISNEDYAFLSAFVYNNKRGLRNVLDLIPSWTALARVGRTRLWYAA